MLYFSLPYRKLINWKMRSPACRMILLIFWRRKNGWSSFWLPTSRSAKSPQSWIQISLWSPCLLPTPASPLCARSHRPPSQRHPRSLPANQPSPQLPTRSSAAAALAAAAAPLSSLPPTSPATWWSWQIWTPPFWRSLWICWRRQKRRRRGLCQRSICLTPSTQLRTGSLFTPQAVTMTLSPCAHLWWLAHQPAPPSPHPSCLPFQRRRPSPPVASPTGEEATAMTSPLIPSAPPPCLPFKDFKKHNSNNAHVLDVKDVCRSQGYGMDLYQEAKYFYIYLPLSLLAYYIYVASWKACFNWYHLVVLWVHVWFNGAIDTRTCRSAHMCLEQ